MISAPHIGTLTNKSILKEFLFTDRAYHAYAIADLAEPYFSQSAWWAAQKDGQINALVLLYGGLSPTVVFSMGGDVDAVSALAGAMPLPKRAMVLGGEGHMAVWQDFYRFAQIDAMWRMILAPEKFAPPAGVEVARRLDKRHIPQLLELYRHEYGNAFAPYQIENGVFYGIFDGERLVAVAGTHIVAPEFGVAAIGNVLTVPAYRNRGYGRRVTAAVCADLLARGFDTLVLNVMQSNQSAIRVYQHLGFTFYKLFEEGIGTLKK